MIILIKYFTNKWLIRYTRYLEEKFISTNELKQLNLNEITTYIKENEVEKEIDITSEILTNKIDNEEILANNNKIIHEYSDYIHSNEETSAKKNLSKKKNVEKKNKKKKLKRASILKSESNISIVSKKSCDISEQTVTMTLGDNSDVIKSQPDKVKKSYDISEQTVIFENSDMNKSQLDEIKLDKSSFKLDENWISIDHNISLNMSSANKNFTTEKDEIKPKKKKSSKKKKKVKIISKKFSEDVKKPEKDKNLFKKANLVIDTVDHGKQFPAAVTFGNTAFLQELKEQK